MQNPGGLPHVKQLAQLLWLVPMVLAPPMYVLAHCEPLTVNPGAQRCEWVRTARPHAQQTPREQAVRAPRHVTAKTTRGLSTLSVCH